MTNPAITAALIAASRQEDVEEKIEGRLKKANAISPASSIALQLRDKEQALLDQALGAGTVKRTAHGRLYLDELAVADRKEGQGFRAILILVAVASIMASIGILLVWSGG